MVYPAKVHPAQSVEEVYQFLHAQSLVETPVAGDVPAELVAHGVECAESLQHTHPDDLELQIAGLLHDVGLLLVPGDELGHPRHGAGYVRSLFGERCAILIGLHVDAQRYLEMTVDGHKVTPPPTAAFAEQPAPMTSAELTAFEAHPLFTDSLDLRGADDHSSGTGRRAEGLERWRERMHVLADASGPGEV